MSSAPSSHDIVVVVVVVAVGAIIIIFVVVVVVVVVVFSQHPVIPVASAPSVPLWFKPRCTHDVVIDPTCMCARRCGRSDWRCMG